MQTDISLNVRDSTIVEPFSQQQSMSESDINVNYNYGYIEDGPNVNSVYDVHNRDIFDTLSPLFNRRTDLSPIERALLQAIIVLQHNTTRYIDEINKRLNDLEKNLDKLEIGLERETMNRLSGNIYE